MRQENILKVIRGDSQVGYGGACKVGYEAGESPYVCFLNSDCVIEDPNWLRSMGETLLNLKQSGVRMVAPMTNNSVNGDPAQTGIKFLKEEDVVLSNDSFLTLPCFLCHRELFPRVGGFLKSYPFGCYEDEEFAHRLKHYGYKQAVCRSSYVHHEGSATFKEVTRRDPNGAGIAIESNRDLCIKDMKLLSKKS
jgi:GT2 family glycosyltransferase